MSSLSFPLIRQPKFLAIWLATVLLFLAAPWLAPGSVSASSLLTVSSFAAVLAICSPYQSAEGFLFQPAHQAEPLKGRRKFCIFTDYIMVPWILISHNLHYFIGYRLSLACTRNYLIQH